MAALHLMRMSVKQSLNLGFSTDTVAEIQLAGTF